MRLLPASEFFCTEPLPSLSHLHPVRYSNGQSWKGTADVKNGMDHVAGLLCERFALHFALLLFSLQCSHRPKQQWRYRGRLTVIAVTLPITGRLQTIDLGVQLLILCRRFVQCRNRFACSVAFRFCIAACRFGGYRLSLFTCKRGFTLGVLLRPCIPFRLRLQKRTVLITGFSTD